MKEIPCVLNQLSQALLLDADIGDTSDGPMKSLRFLDFIRRTTGSLFGRNSVQVYMQLYA